MRTNGWRYLRGGLRHTCTLATTLIMPDLLFCRSISHVRRTLCWAAWWSEQEFNLHPGLKHPGQTLSDHFSRHA